MRKRCGGIGVAVLAVALGAIASPSVAVAQQSPINQGVTPINAATPAPLPPASLASPLPGASDEPTAEPTAPTGRRLAAFTVQADRITFYSNRYIMRANGHVTLELGDGTRVAGNVLYYDLRLNRVQVAGGVKIDAANSEITGAAFAEYFDFDRAYFLPILSEPDRWTFSEGNYAHPLFGRQMPGDTFYLPDLSGERVFLYAKKALVDPHRSIRFTPADINFGFTRVPFPSYFLTYSPNPYLAQNALGGAFADGPLDFAGGQNTLATVHLRYDNIEGPFAALEAHLVSDNSYLVASANPITRPLKQYNLLAYDRITPGLQFQGQFQESAFQSGFSQPLSATAFTNMQLTASLPHSYLQLNDLQYYQSLLARPGTSAIDGQEGERVYFYGDPSHDWIPDHPNTTSLAWIGLRNPIAQLPFYLQLRSSVGVSNNSDTPIEYLPAAPPNGVGYVKEFDKAAGFNVSSKSINILPDRANRHRDLYFTGYYDRQREYFSIPHHIDTAITNLALTKIFDPQLTFIAAYTNTNVGDYYGDQQLDVYRPNARYFNTYTDRDVKISPGFRGLGTVRSFTQQILFVPSQAVTLTASMRENDDFPHPIPGGLQIVGDALGFVNYGATPYELDLDARIRISRILVLDIARSDYFNFGGIQRWSPAFNFQVEK